jgi:oligopeptide/dipeptide ABC transporter ATP-binding protein
MPDALIETRGLSKTFQIGRTQKLRAVSEVDLTLHPGETLAVVGESGCGKSTLARLLLRLEEPTEGSIKFDGIDVSGHSGRAEKAWRRGVQMVFQDPKTSLNPRMTAHDAIREPLDNFREGTAADRDQRVHDLLLRVGLNATHGRRYPHELSGGQCQRLGIARALALRPKVIVADEPVSALDVSIQAQVLNLIMDLQDELGISIVFVSHDLSVVRHVSDRVMVMYLGRVVEEGNAEAVLERPAHPYTQALLGSVPIDHPSKRRDRQPLKGEIASPLAPPSGCAFRARCPMAEAQCAAEVPELKSISHGGKAACHLLEKT